jgi:Domain of unknown function (DUF4337)
MPAMPEIAETVTEAVEKARESKLNTFIAASVAVTATFMALCNVKDGNVVQAMQQAQSSGVDAWSYYQAKGTKLNIAEAAVDQLTVERDTLPGLTDAGRALLDQKIGEQTAKARKYEAEKEDIKKSAEGFQKEYDRLNFHDDQFDMAEASLSISIALFGVTALTQKRWLAWIACGFVVFGFTLGLAGFLGLSVHPDFLARILS